MKKLSRLLEPISMCVSLTKVQKRLLLYTYRRFLKYDSKELRFKTIILAKHNEVKTNQSEVSVSMRQLSELDFFKVSDLCSGNKFLGKKVELTNDIDLKGYVLVLMAIVNLTKAQSRIVQKIIELFHLYDTDVLRVRNKDLSEILNIDSSYISKGIRLLKQSNVFHFYVDSKYTLYQGYTISLSKESCNLLSEK